MKDVGDTAAIHTKLVKYVVHDIMCSALNYVGRIRRAPRVDQEGLIESERGLGYDKAHRGWRGMRCVLGPYAREDYARCDEAVLPQWCVIHRTTHQQPVDLTVDCRIAPTCDSCEAWLHDECGRSPGFVNELARRVVQGPLLQSFT